MAFHDVYHYTLEVWHILFTFTAGSGFLYESFLQAKMTKSDSLQREVTEVRQRLTTKMDFLRQEIRASRRDMATTLKRDALIYQLQTEISSSRELENKLQASKDTIQALQKELDKHLSYCISETLSAG